VKTRWGHEKRLRVRAVPAVRPSHWRRGTTGYNLSGYSGEPDVSSTSETDGPPVDSCPAGPWSLTSAAGEPETISSTSTGGLYVNDVLLP